MFKDCVKTSKCLIVDDDNEVCIPFTESPLDAYRGRGIYKQSLECKYNCIPHLIGKGNTCFCNDRVEKLYEQKAKLKTILDTLNGEQLVGFGKCKFLKWCSMFDGNEISSWSNWYLRTCTNKGKFYEYLELLRKYKEIEHDIRTTENPNYD